MPPLRSSLAIALVIALFVPSVRSAQEERISALRFEEAWSRVLAAAKTQEWLDEERTAVAAEAEQAALLPNPELSAEIEDVLGTGPFRGIDGTEVAVQVEQTFESSGKRDARRALAESASGVAEADLRVELADLRLVLANAFFAVAEAQDRRDLRREWQTLAHRTLETVRRQNEAGQASGIELARVRVELSAAQVALRAAENAYDRSRRTLAALWGADEPDFTAVTSPPAGPRHLPELQTLMARLDATPDLRQFDAISAQREAALAAEKTAVQRDVTVSGGVRYYREGDEAAFLVGVSIPILVRNRNEGGIRAARARLRQVPLEAARTKLALQSELASRYAELATASEEALALEEQVLPGAREVLRQIEAAHAEGRIPLIQVLDAQRSLLNARTAHLDASIRFRQALISLNRLLGTDALLHERFTR